MYRDFDARKERRLERNRMRRKNRPNPGEIPSYLLEKYKELAKQPTNRLYYSSKRNELVKTFLSSFIGVVLIQLAALLVKWLTR